MWRVSQSFLHTGDHPASDSLVRTTPTDRDASRVIIGAFRAINNLCCFSFLGGWGLLGRCESSPEAPLGEC
jgi:hypothetical protein